MPSQGKRAAGVSPRRRRSSVRQPSAEELELFRLVSEQVAIPVDQLARFFGVYVSDMTRVVGELAARGWLAVGELLTAEPPWVWMRTEGGRLLGMGFRAVAPKVWGLPHMRAINEARLLVTELAPEGRWVCERVQRREWAAGRIERIPDAVFEINGERHAIEVELSRKTVDRLRVVIAQHSFRYDAVVYLCSRVVARYMKRQGLLEEFPLLVIRPLLDDVRDVRPDGFGLRAAPEVAVGRRSVIRGEVGSREVGVLRLISEQGLIPMDQLARFLGCEEELAGATMSEFVERGLVKRACPLADEPDWVWLTPLGCELSETGLAALYPKVGSLPRARAINEVRLQLPDRLSGGWTSARVLRRLLGQAAPRPAAVVDVDGELHAIEVALTKRDFKSLIRRRCADYDVVMVFCAPAAYGCVTRLARSGGWPNLVVRKLAGGWRVGAGRRLAVRAVGQSQPSRPQPLLAEVSLEELPGPALTALREVHDDLGKGQLVSVERRLRPSSPEWYRVVTDAGVWRVLRRGSRWHAAELARRFEVGERRYRSVHEYDGYQGGSASITGLRRREFLRHAGEDRGESYTVNGYAERCGIGPRSAYRDLCWYVEIGLFTRRRAPTGLARLDVYWAVSDFAERVKTLDLLSVRR